MTVLDRNGKLARTVANQRGLDLIEFSDLADRDATRFVFRLRAIVDPHSTEVGNQSGFGRVSVDDFRRATSSVRAAMRLDTLRALLDSDEPIDLLGAMSAADAYAMCERASVRLMEKADEYKRAM